MSLGHRLKKSREQMGLSRSELSRLAQVPYPTIAAIEDGSIRTSGHTPALARALGVDAFWLGNGERHSTTTPNLPLQAAGDSVTPRAIANLTPLPGREILSADEAALLGAFRALPAGQQAAVMALVSSLAQAETAPHRPEPKPTKD